MTGARRGWGIAAIATALVAAIVWSWPLATALGTAVPTHQWHCLGRGCEDEFLCVWIVTALGQRLAEAPLALFEGGILLPLRHTLAFSETMLSAVALTAPVTWLTGNHVLAYNLYYLATIALAVLGTYLVVRDATGDPRAALVAGLFFGLAGERWADRGHLAKLSVHWVPFVCWTWLRFVDRPSARRGAALAAATLANLHAGVYQGLALPVLLVPWAGVLAASRPWPLQRWFASLAVIAGVTLVGLLPYWPFVVVREEQSFVSGGLAEVVGGWAWYTAGFLHPLEYLQRVAEPNRTAVSMSPLPLVALAAAALAAGLGRRHAGATPGERAHLLAALAFMLFTAASTVSEERLGPFGPAMHALFALPGLDGLRGRNRFVLLVAFGGALVLGIALAMVLRRVTRQGIAATFAIVGAAAVVADTRTLHESTPLTWLPGPRDLPPAVALATRSDAAGGLLHLPYGHWASETLYMMWALHHRHPIMNGYTAIMPRFGTLVRDFPAPATLQALAEAGVTHVLLHPRAMTGFGVPMVERIRSATNLSQVLLGDTMLVTVPRDPPRRPPLAGRPLARDGWRLEGSDPDAALAADGDLATHWTAVTIDRPTSLRVDLGRTERVAGVRLRLAMHWREYPHAWEAWGSRDGSAWERLGGERITPAPFASYRRDHRAIAVDLPFPPADVRMLELRVPQQRTFVAFDGHGLGTWGVHELEVLGD